MGLIDEVHRNVQMILNWSTSTIRESRRFLEFSHRLRAKEGDLDLNGIVSEATDMIRDRCEREGIMLLIGPDQSMLHVRCRRGQLLQLFLHLVQNAREAVGTPVPEGGLWRRRTRVVGVEDDRQATRR